MVGFLIDRSTVMLNYWKAFLLNVDCLEFEISNTKYSLVVHYNFQFLKFEPFPFCKIEFISLLEIQPALVFTNNDEKRIFCVIRLV